MCFVLKSELGLGSIRRHKLNRNHICQEWRTRVDSIFDKSEFLKDVEYKVVFYGKTVKGKQDSAAMDHPVVKGKQMAWRRRTKAMVKSEWSFVPMDCARPWEAMSDSHQSHEESRINGVKILWKLATLKGLKVRSGTWKYSKGSNWFKCVLSLKLSLGMPHY